MAIKKNMSDSDSSQDVSASDSDDSKALENGDSDTYREKGDATRPPTKVVIRRLPPSMTKDVLIKHLSPIPPYDYFLFVKADKTLGPNAFSRAYINFIHHNDIYQFKERFDDYIFLDKKGNEFHAVVEFSPFQRLSKKTGINSNDPKCDTLEQDPTYISFLENYMLLNNSSAGTYTSLEYFPAADDQVTTTPLLDFIRERHAKKQRIKDERKDERRRKDYDRRQAKDFKDEDHGKQKISDTFVKSQLQKKDKPFYDKDSYKRKNPIQDKESRETESKSKETNKSQEKSTKSEKETNSPNNDPSSKSQTSDDQVQNKTYENNSNKASAKDGKYSDRTTSASKRYDKYQSYSKDNVKPFKKSYGSSSWEHSAADKRNSFKYDKKTVYRSDQISKTESVSPKNKGKSRNFANDAPASSKLSEEQSFQDIDVKKDMSKSTSPSAKVKPNGKKPSVFFSRQKSESSDPCKLVCCQIPKGITAKELMTPLELALWCQRNSSNSFVWSVRKLFNWKSIIAFHKAHRFDDIREDTVVLETELIDQLAEKNYSEVLQLFSQKTNSKQDHGGKTSAEEYVSIKKGKHVADTESTNEVSNADHASGRNGGDMEVMLRRNLEAILRSDSDETPGSLKSSKSEKPKDPRTERRIRNKDRPDMQIYRPGMGKFSMLRKERENKVVSGSSVESESSPSVSPTPSGSVIRSGTFRRSVSRDK